MGPLKASTTLQPFLKFILRALLLMLGWANTGLASPANELIKAAANGNMADVQHLLDEGVEVDAKDRNGGYDPLG